jgi:hypothetical protein
MKKIAFLFSLCLIFWGTTAIAQNSKSKDEANKVWNTLGKITYKKQYDEMMGFKIDVPVFSPEVKALEGKVVTIRGYIIPVEGYKSHKEFVFSAFPYNMCFFCGGAGPETVMEIEAAEAIKYTTDPITIKGKLSLNDSDINRLIYAMTEVVLVKE